MPRNDALLRISKTLLARRSELRKRLGSEMEDLGHAKNSTPSGGDSADAAFDSGSEELASQLAELEARELHQIERALKRLKQKTYGLCEVCSGRIAILRLSALPYCTLCINCQREMEKDAHWLESRMGGNWDKVSDGDAADEPREIDLSDLEMDLSK
jgi:DnaK suppressor protein